MSFKNFLQDSAGEINNEIESFFDGWSKDVVRISPRLKGYCDAFWSSCRGGKRIRGALVILGYEIGLDLNRIASSSASRRTPRNDIIKAAAAYEIFQAAILAHDDIIDKSEERRGIASLYMKLGGDHAGISKAICLGDIGFFIAYKILSESSFAEKEKNKALGIFSGAMLDTGIGELLDVDIATGQNKVDKKDIISVYTYKTAFYTIVTPLVLGGILGKMGQRSIKALKLFGQNLGIAFQIKDDINDIFEGKQKLGKEPGGDIREGKKTLLYWHALNCSNTRQKEILNKYYGNSKIGIIEIERVREVFEASGARRQGEEEAKEYSAKAKDAIGGITRNEIYRGLLSEMADFFV